MIILFKSNKFRVFKTFLNVKSYRHRVEGIFTNAFIEVFHVQEQSLFVTEMVIVFKFVVDFVWIHFKLL